jgi:N-methylhydantoinase A
VGSDILREVREFERGSTAALNGYVQPIVSRYLGRLSQSLRSAGLSNELLVM